MPIVSLAYRVTSGGIVSGSIGNNAVLSGNIASGQIGQFKLSSGSVNSGHIGNNAVISGSIASGTIDTIHISSGGIKNINIENDAIKSGNIASGQIGIYHFASGVLNQQEIYIYSGLLNDTIVYSGTINRGMSAIADYAAYNSLTSGYRAGNVTTIWNPINSTIVYNETSTQDLGGSTLDLHFSTSILSGNLQINANIASGNFNLRIIPRFI